MFAYTLIQKACTVLQRSRPKPGRNVNHPAWVKPYPKVPAQTKPESALKPLTSSFMMRISFGLQMPVCLYSAQMRGAPLPALSHIRLQFRTHFTHQQHSRNLRSAFFLPKRETKATKRFCSFEPRRQTNNNNKISLLGTYFTSCKGWNRPSAEIVKKPKPSPPCSILAKSLKPKAFPEISHCGELQTTGPSAHPGRMKIKGL